MYDVHHVEVLPELFILSQNFQEPIGVLVAGEQPYTVTGIVEEVRSRRIKMEGQWIRLSNVIGVEP